KNTEGLVVQIIFKMVNNAEDRKDLAQEVYLKAYRNLSGFKFQAKLSTWIGQIAYNTCVNYLNKKKLMLLDEGLEQVAHKRQEFQDDNLHIWLQNKELSNILELAMADMPPLYKTILSLFHKEELSYKEIAAITGLREGTLKSYLFRARRKMRDNLLQKYKKEDL
ncbi:MAG: sigma-70 family RNA polymerase sigma factor, partial [Bacteroidota bacterium]